MVNNPNDPAVNLEPGVMGETEPPEQKVLDQLNTIATGYFMGKMGGDAAEALIGKIGSKLANVGKFADDYDLIHHLAGLTPEESASAKAVLPSQEPTEAGARIREMWVNKAKAEGTPQQVRAAYQYPETFSNRPPLPKIAIDPETGASPIKGPHAIYIGTQKSLPGSMPVDMYDVRNSSLNTASNERLTLAGADGLDKLRRAGIPIVGKDPRAGEAIPAMDYTKLFKNVSPASLLGAGFPLSQQNQSVLQSVKDKLVNYKDSKYGKNK